MIRNSEELILMSKSKEPSTSLKIEQKKYSELRYTYNRVVISIRLTLL